MGNISKLRVGIVGCGYQGGRLASAIKLVDGLALTACADIVLQKAEDLAASAGQAIAYASAEEMLAGNEVDLVMVATPHHVLAPISLLAIQAGKHILAEKPCAMNTGEMAQVEEAVEKAGISYLAGYSFRYIPAWYKAHELLEQGVLGEIQSVLGCIGIGPLNQGWISSPETGGGPLMFLGTHLVDQVLWYLQDEPVEVYASTRYRKDTGTDETSAFQITFTRGATAQLMVTQASSSFINQVDIYGREGSLSLRPCGFLDYEVTVTSRLVEAYNQPTVIHVPVAGDVRDVKHSRQLTEFLQAIHTGQTPFVPVQQARQVMEVIDAVFASARTGEAVSLKQAARIGQP